MSARDTKVLRDPLELAGARLLDRYLIEAVIAQGGMAVIYRGRDLRLLRPVCVKVFHRIRPGDLAYRTSYDHFIQEAFALSQFSHPNTLRIYDFGYLDGGTCAPFQISEMLEGGTLGQLIKRHGALPPVEALAILEPIAGALAEAHARGIIHRDIKPSNILFGLAGTRRVVKLCDFGIAKVNDVAASPNRADDTVAQLRLYSPGWAAPEQICGEAIGPAVDVFALGLVAGYMLTGKSPRVEPFDGSALPPAVTAVVERACREQVEARFASVDELAAALRAAIEAAPVQPMPVVDSGPIHRPGVTTGPIVALAAEELLDAPTGAGRALVVDPSGDDEVLVGGRRMRLVPMAGSDQIDLGGDGPWLHSTARFRVTITPSAGQVPRLNVKGLNCFVARPGARPTTAVDVEADMDVDLLSTDRRPLDGVRCTLGRSDQTHRLYDLGAVTVAVPSAAGAVLLDLGPGRELALLHRGPAPLPRGRR